MWRLLIILAIVGALGVGFVYLFKTNDRKTNISMEQNTVPEELTPPESVPSPAAPANKLTNDFSKPFSMTIDQNKKYSATLHTSAGDIVINLNAKGTPITVNNFVNLAQDKFYDNTIFHRVIDGFMIQGGDPKGDGTGGPGYRFADEPFTGEYTRGTVAMANAGPNTNGSQFFIMHATYPLPKNYVIFGSVVSGLDVVDKIATAPVQSNGMEMSRPVNPVVVSSVDIKED